MDFLLQGHEINLKGGNRAFFTSRLRQNLKLLLAGTGSRVRMQGFGFHLTCPDEMEAEVRARLNRALGVQKIVAGRRAENNTIEAISAVALETIAAQSGDSFGLDVRRPDKDVPLTSQQVAIEAGRYIQQQLGLKVNLRHPERVCTIVLSRDGTLVSRAPEPGPGGMPAGTAGRLMALISAGFDSPVAAYRLIRRGANVGMVHFYGSGSRTGESSRLVVDGIARALTRYQFHTSIYFCRFEPVQREIVLGAPSKYRVLLYRRMMLRIAESIARRNNIHGLITGDSLAQVASQTIRNLEAVGAATSLPIYRPLIGDDKITIMDEARRIGTYDLSAESTEDCCSAFMPQAPALTSSPCELEEAESGLDISALIQLGLSHTESRRYHLQDDRVVESHPPRGPVKD